MNPLFVNMSSWITYRTSGVDDVICEPESMERRPAAGACDRAALFRKRDESRPRGMAQRAAAGGRGVPMAHLGVTASTRTAVAEYPAPDLRADRRLSADECAGLNTFRAALCTRFRAAAASGGQRRRRPPSPCTPWERWPSRSEKRKCQIYRGPRHELHGGRSLAPLAPLLRTVHARHARHSGSATAAEIPRRPIRKHGVISQKSGAAASPRSTTQQAFASLIFLCPCRAAASAPRRTTAAVEHGEAEKRPPRTGSFFREPS